jgi:hypothetical protein
MMRRGFATLFFVLGCLMAGFAVVWWIAAEFGVLLGPRTGVEGVVAFIPYAILMGITLDRYSVHNWPPVLKVTHSRIILARVLLSLAAANLAIGMAVTGAGRITASASLLGHGRVWVLAGLLLLNGVYVALHWAFRPNNIFGPNVPEALLDPLGSLALAILKVIRRMRNHSEQNGNEGKPKL